MSSVLEVMKPEIESTIKRLNLKHFEPDPIAGPHFSKITSVMSSAYKRHGYILERAILEALRLCRNHSLKTAGMTDYVCTRRAAPADIPSRQA